MAAAYYIKPPLISWDILGSGVYAPVTMSQKVGGVSMAAMRLPNSAIGRRGKGKLLCVNHLAGNEWMGSFIAEDPERKRPGPFTAREPHWTQYIPARHDIS